MHSLQLPHPLLSCPVLSYPVLSCPVLGTNWPLPLTRPQRLAQACPARAGSSATEATPRTHVTLSHAALSPRPQQQLPHATRSSQQLDVQALTALAQIMLNNTFPELPALRRAWLHAGLVQCCPRTEQPCPSSLSLQSRGSPSPCTCPNLQCSTCSPLLSGVCHPKTPRSSSRHPGSSSAPVFAGFSCSAAGLADPSGAPAPGPSFGLSPDTAPAGQGSYSILQPPCDECLDAAASGPSSYGG